MTRPQQSIDGFIPRRTDQRSQIQPFGEATSRPAEHNDLALRTPTAARAEAPHSASLVRSELDESLRALNHDDGTPVGIKPAKKNHSRRRRIIKRVIIALVLLAVIIGGWVGIRALIAASNVFQGNLLGIFQSQALKEDKNGRSNILVFGTSEDDPGHDGALLTDSIMVVSANQKQKNVSMVSIPRDLYVKYGAGCNAGYEGKINEIYNCFSDGGADEPAGANALKDKVGEILGLDIQYYAHLNYGVIKESVDAVGGVDVKIESSDPRGILDRNFDWKCPNGVSQSCYNVRYANGTHHLDGEHALYLARARGDDPLGRTYGLAGGNFDREGYQQKILIALKDKAASTGTLTNIGKVSSLVDAFGKNLRTNFETNEIRTLMSLGQDTPNSAIARLNLVEDGNELVTTGMYNGASIVRPVAGLMDYSDIQLFITQKFSSDPVLREGATIDVYNGSGVAGAAKQQSDALKAAQFNIGTTANVPVAGTFGPVELYMISTDKSATQKKLEKQLGVSAKTSPPPFAVTGVDFVVIIGQAPANPTN